MSSNMSSIQAQLSNTTSRKAIQPNNENEFIESQSNSVPLLPLRSPLITIPDPSQNPKEEIIQENDLLDFKANRFEGNHRFGHRKIETLISKTPNRNGVRGKVHSESKSAHNTPSRSVSLVSASNNNNGALGFCTGNRPIQEIGIRGGSSSKVLRRFSIAPSELSTQVPCFDLVEDPSFWTDHNVQVLIRIRPINHMERALQGNVTCLKQESAHSLSWLGHPETRFTFDHIACEMISQEKLFKVAGLPMVENCMSGYNSCMFAYGQTGSGKTYTMMGDIHEIDGKLNEDCGLTPRIFEYLFTRISMEEECQKDEKLRYSCKCSFLEIYNEQITDLLEPSSTNLQLREDLGKGVYVENLTEWEVTTVQDVIQLLLKGSANRKMAATNMNSESSRSHSVFTCIIESRREIDSVTHLRFGRLNLVDLAGSERQKSSGAEGERLKEAANINKSLSTLGLVIMTLVDVAHGKHRHVPYRDSRLTFLLQDSLGGNSKTTIIANISPSICSANETLSTLKFAQRAKLIQNNAKINEDTSGDVNALQRQIQQLKDQLTILLKHQNFSKAPTLCPNFEQSQSGEVGDTSASTLEGKNSDHQNTMIFPKEKMGGIKATLVGALRREEMADTAVRRLEAELEHMNRLVLQREEDAQRTKMIVRFREEKIKRLQLLSDGLVSADEYLMEENKALLEENQLLQERIDRNPELTRFALENIRLIEQLRMFQDFYEQGERETLLAEISELRDQLVETLQGNYRQPKLANQKTDIASELVDCQRNLDECVEVNAKLIMEVDQLQRELNIYTDCTRADPVADSSRDPGTNCRTERHSSVEIISIKSESEDEIASYNKEDQVFHIKNSQKMDDTFTFQRKDLQKELLDAKYIIEAMECEQLLLIDEMNILQKKNLQYEQLLGKKDPEDQLQETSDRGPRDTYLLTDGSADITRRSLTSKLERLNRELEQARILNKRYLNDQEFQNLHQNEFEQVCQQVEVETANTILHLQEELAKFQEKIIFLSKENSRLRIIIGTKDDEFRLSTEKWEKALLELTSFLVDGSRSLDDASEHIGSIANSFPEQKGLVCDQVERAANCFLEKERTILKLQNSLEDAQQLGQEMLSKLNSLKGATIAITEIQQLETDDSSREVIKLHTLLSEKMAKIEELERKFKNEEQILEAGKGNDTQGKCFNTCNHLGVDNQEELNQYAVQQMAPQLEPSELRLEEAEAGGSNGTEVQHAKLSDAIFFGEEKIKMASSFFSKFEEAQATIEDADTMLNALLTANENAKIMTSMWKQAAEDLMMEGEDLIEEARQFKSSLCLKEGEYESMQAQIHSSLAEIALSVTTLEESFLQMQSDVEMSFKVVYSDIFSLGQDLLGFICKSRSSMEDIWTEIMGNGFASFVLYQCYAEKLSERISSLRLDSDAFHYKQKNCYSILKNVGKGFTSATGGKSVLKDTNNREGHTENSQNKVCGLGKIVALKTEEDEMGLDCDSLIFDNLSLKRELARKDVLLKGLLFDISLLQESTSSSMDVKDETEEMFATLTMVRNELGVKTTQLDEILLKQKELETKLVDCNAAICISNSKLNLANEAIEMLSNKNSDLIIEIENLKVKKNIVEDQLEEQKDVVKGLEEEILRLASSIGEKDIPSIEDIEDDLRRVTAERDHLQEEVLSLNDKLEMAKALVDENEALAVEARQESEASKVYAEQKEEEATILEHSVEELERTINVLEKKVYDMGSEVERHYMRRNDLEVELEALRLRMLTVENSTENMDSQGSDLGLGNYQTSRLSVVRAQDLEEAKEQIRVLEKDRADMAREIKECREYISELVLHAEAQALQYQQKYKTLETMVREVKIDSSDSSFVPPPSDIIEKSSMRTRGSSSPFRCIASLVQQMKIEKDQEMSEAKLKIEELQALACSRKKEVCVLNARLAAAENMTHDVIRDLLGVKLDMTNYANLIDQHQVQNLVEEAHQQTEKYFAKEQENLKLREKIDELTEEIQSCIEEINQKETDILAAQVRLEQLQQRDQMLLAQNEMLKMDKLTLKRKIAEMDELLKRNHRPLSVQQQIQQPNKNKENSFLRCSSEELTKKLTKSDKLLSHLNDELAWYTNSDSSDPNNRKESGL